MNQKKCLRQPDDGWSDRGFYGLLPNLKNKKEDHFEKKQVPSTIENKKVNKMKKKS